MAVAERKKSLHAFINNPTNSNQTNLRICRAKARQLLNKIKVTVGDHMCLSIVKLL